LSILVHRRMLVFVLGVAFGLAAVFALSRASSAASPNGVPPELLTVDMVEEDACPDFPVHFEGTLKAKAIEKPDGSFIFVGPGFRMTLTNLEDPDNQITVHNTAGAGHSTRLPNGNILLVVTGPHIEWPPLRLFVGRVTLLIDGDRGNVIRVVSSKGKTVDLCARLA
jgi:hypothetical protein